jgi:hypothetical protein
VDDVLELLDGHEPSIAAAGSAPPPLLARRASLVGLRLRLQLADDSVDDAHLLEELGLLVEGAAGLREDPEAAEVEVGGDRRQARPGRQPPAADVFCGFL